MQHHQTCIMSTFTHLFWILIPVFFFSHKEWKTMARALFLAISQTEFPEGFKRNGV